MSDYKPGTVAFVKGVDGEVLAFRQERQWATLNHLYFSDWQLSDARSLVVIDPEDREAIERLVKVLSTGQPLIGLDPMNRKVVDEAWISHTQAALREFANPTSPKPDMPRGIGAVAEDENGGIWVQTLVEANYGAWCKSGDGDNFRAWSEIPIVRVLSSGYTEDGDR